MSGTYRYLPDTNIETAGLLLGRVPSDYHVFTAAPGILHNFTVQADRLYPLQFC